jgi:hypothetical protein
MHVDPSSYGSKYGYIHSHCCPWMLVWNSLLNFNLFDYMSTAVELLMVLLL